MHPSGSRKKSVLHHFCCAFSKTLTQTERRANSSLLTRCWCPKRRGVCGSYTKTSLLISACGSCWKNTLCNPNHIWWSRHFQATAKANEKTTICTLEFKFFGGLTSQYHKWLHHLLALKVVLGTLLFGVTRVYLRPRISSKGQNTKMNGKILKQKPLLFWCQCHEWMKREGKKVPGHFPLVSPRGLAGQN